MLRRLEGVLTTFGAGSRKDGAEEWGEEYRDGGKNTVCAPCENILQKKKKGVPKNQLAFVLGVKEGGDGLCAPMKVRSSQKTRKYRLLDLRSERITSIPNQLGV